MTYEELEAEAAAMREALEKYDAKLEEVWGISHRLRIFLSSTAGRAFLERMRKAEGDSLTLDSFCKAHGTPMTVLSERDAAIARAERAEARAEDLKRACEGKDELIAGADADLQSAMVELEKWKASRNEERRLKESIEDKWCKLNVQLDAANARAEKAEVTVRLQADDLDAGRANESWYINERDALRTRVEKLEGLKPELPPFPPQGSGLPRYGLRWNGPTEPLAVPMDDGYWTPWHLADALRAELEKVKGLLRVNLTGGGDGLHVYRGDRGCGCLWHEAARAFLNPPAPKPPCKTCGDSKMVLQHGQQDANGFTVCVPCPDCTPGGAKWS